LLIHKLPIDQNGIAPNDEMTVHLIVVGFGRMGHTIIVKAAQLGQFINRKQIQISIIDRNATENQASLLFHHPCIGEVANLTFYKQEVLSPDTRSLIEKWCNEPGKLVNIVYCFDNPSLAYDAVFNLLPLFNRKNIRVAVRMNEPETFEFLLRKIGSEKFNDLTIKSFGLENDFDGLINPEMNENEVFAMDIHSVYVQMKLEEFDDNPEELRKLKSSLEMKPWHELTEDLRESNRQQAFHIFIKLRACGYEITGISDSRPAINTFDPAIFEALAIMEHDRWIAERKVNNWKYGKESVKEHRINKNLVDWEQLPDEIKKYDYEAVANIPKLLERVGKKMVEKQPVIE